MLKAHLITPKVVILMDGGVCSQMLQYLLGEFFRKRGCKVVYDLSFYKEWGSDLNYKFARNFDLLKVFPYLELTTATELEISYYKRHFYYVGNNTSERIDDFSFLEKNPPIYLGGYYHLPIGVWVPAFMSTYRLSSDIFDENSKILMSEIKQNINSVAVHVRRGDLSVEVPAYGKPASLNYFKRAVDYMEKETVTPFFYFFLNERLCIRPQFLGSLMCSAVARKHLRLPDAVFHPGFAVRSIVQKKRLYLVQHIGKLRLRRLHCLKLIPQTAVLHALCIRKQPENTVRRLQLALALGLIALGIVCVGVPGVDLDHIVKQHHLHRL